MKSDINLLYNRKTNQDNGKKWIALLIGAVFFAGALYVGIALPTNALSAAKMDVAALESQLNENADIEQSLIEKTTTKANLEEQLKALKLISTAKSDISLYIETVEASLPTDAVITQLLLFEESLEITGVANNDEVLATFYLRLREKNLFDDLFISTSSVLKGSQQITTFKLTGTLPTSLTQLGTEEEEMDQEIANVTQNEEAVQ